MKNTFMVSELFMASEFWDNVNLFYKNFKYHKKAFLTKL